MQKLINRYDGSKPTELIRQGLDDIEVGDLLLTKNGNRHMLYKVNQVYSDRMICRVYDISRTFNTVTVRYYCYTISKIITRNLLVYNLGCIELRYVTGQFKTDFPEFFV